MTRGRVGRVTRISVRPWKLGRRVVAGFDRFLVPSGTRPRHPRSVCFPRRSSSLYCSGGYGWYGEASVTRYCLAGCAWQVSRDIDHATRIYWFVFVTGDLFGDLFEKSKEPVFSFFFLKIGNRKLELTGSRRASLSDSLRVAISTCYCLDLFHVMRLWVYSSWKDGFFLVDFGRFSISNNFKNCYRL